jgi:hypothetical protein
MYMSNTGHNDAIFGSMKCCEPLSCVESTWGWILLGTADVLDETVYLWLSPFPLPPSTVTQELAPVPGTLF